MNGIIYSIPIGCHIFLKMSWQFRVIPGLLQSKSITRLEIIDITENSG